MQIRPIITALAITVCVLAVHCTAAFAQVIDGPIATEHLERQVLSMLYLEKFDDLERMAKEFRSTKAKFPDGRPKLHYYYTGFAAPRSRSAEGWRRFLARLEAWRQKYPQSTTARVAAAEAWLGYAAEARGGGYADTVTAQGRRLLDERCEKAYALVAGRPQRSSDDCPERYALLFDIAKIQGWSKPQYEKLFHEAITFAPSYYIFYVQKAIFLLPKWHGDEGEWQEFAKACLRSAPASEGKILYMRIVQSVWNDNNHRSFDAYGVSWETMKQGFLEAEKLFPDSPWLLNNFCRAACVAGDKETARALFKRIADRPYVTAWYYPPRVSEYKKLRDWALGSSELLSFPGGTEDVRQTLLLAQQGDAEAQNKLGDYYRRGEQVVQDEAEAAKWHRKSAEQGHLEAQSTLAMIYFNGKDFKEAAKWYYRAAMQGNSSAASALGMMYQNGFNLEKDLVKAYVWHSLVTQWKAPEVEKLAGQLTALQLKEAELELKSKRAEININMERAEMSPLDPSQIKVPEMAYRTQKKIVIAPRAKLPTANLAEGAKWQVTAGAQGNEKKLSLKDGGDAEMQVKIYVPDGCCLLVGARVRHSRLQAEVKGAPLIMTQLEMGGKTWQQNSGLIVPPTVKEKDGTWYKVQPITSSFEGVGIRFGTVGAKPEDKKGSSTELSDIKMIIYPTCEEARTAGESMFQQ